MDFPDPVRELDEENREARAELDMEKPDEVSLPPLAEAEIPALIERARQSPLWPVVLLCLGCGLRPVEASRVDWSHIDTPSEVLRVFGKKRRRTLRLIVWAARELAALPRCEGPLYPEVTLQACRRTACRRAAQTMSPIDYANYFGHSLAVAHRHYLGFGIASGGAGADSLAY